MELRELGHAWVGAAWFGDEELAAGFAGRADEKWEVPCVVAGEAFLRTRLSLWAEVCCEGLRVLLIRFYVGNENLSGI